LFRTVLISSVRVCVSFAAVRFFSLADAVLKYPYHAERSSTVRLPYSPSMFTPAPFGVGPLPFRVPFWIWGPPTNRDIREWEKIAASTTRQGNTRDLSTVCFWLSNAFSLVGRLIDADD
jgi:hypothetical protein